jgi:hypothetical protein
MAALCASSIASAQEPLGGQPPAGAKQSVADLDAQVAYQRAFEAVLWAMPPQRFTGFASASWNCPAWPTTLSLPIPGR